MARTKTKPHVKAFAEKQVKKEKRKKNRREKDTYENHTRYIDWTKESVYIGVKLKCSNIDHHFEMKKILTTA